MDNQNPSIATPPVAPAPPKSDDSKNSGSQEPTKGFMETLEYYLVTKAPWQIPTHIKELIVRFTPWINIICLITIIPLALAVIGLGSLFSFYAGSYFYHSGWSLFSLINLATLVLGVIALPGLFARKMNGWQMTFYEIAVSFVGSVIYGNIVGGLVSLILGWYILFQIKSYYH